jgi:cobalt-zinc-cadmium efflux system outer membrane protein
MHPRTRTPRTLRLALLACLLAGAGLHAGAQTAASTAPPSPGLKEFFEAAWTRQPEAQALPARLEAARAQQRAAEAWTPEPPALEASHRTDRITRNGGARELELGIAVPLWLPNERRSTSALAEAELAATESRTRAARLRLAGAVRDAWWHWQRAGVDLEIARAQLDSARRIAGDVSRRAQAGELARADRNQADAAVAAAEAALALAAATASTARLQLQALAGTAADALPAATALPEPEPPSGEVPAHPALAEAQDRAAVAQRAAALAATQSRANPELTMATTRDRGAAGERYGQTVTLALRIPLGGAARHDARVAASRAEATEAQAQLALDRARLQAEGEAAATRVEAARVQLAAAERRASLARETRGFFEKSFRLGETDLPTHLRIETEATEADRQAARSRIELAAAVSAWRQALGLLPQ